MTTSVDQLIPWFVVVVVVQFIQFREKLIGEFLLRLFSIGQIIIRF